MIIFMQVCINCLNNFCIDEGPAASGGAEIRMGRQKTAGIRVRAEVLLLLVEALLASSSFPAGKKLQ